MNESVFNLYVPINHLQFMLDQEKQSLAELRSTDAENWSRTNGVPRRRQVAFHLAMVSTYRRHLKFLREYKGPCFRASVLKRDQYYQFLPINCHLQEMVVSTIGAEDKSASCYNVITVGATAAHGLGFKKGGAKSIEDTLKEQLTPENYNLFLATGLLKKPAVSGNLPLHKKISSIPVESEPIRALKDMLEELHIQVQDVYYHLTRLCGNTNPASEKTLQQIEHYRGELRKCVKTLLEGMQRFPYFAPDEEELPKVLVEVLEGASLPQFEACLDDLLKVATQKQDPTSKPEETVVFASTADDSKVALENYSVWEDRVDR